MVKVAPSAKTGLMGSLEIPADGAVGQKHELGRGRARRYVRKGIRAGECLLARSKHDRAAGVGEQ